MTHVASDLSRFAEYPLLEALFKGGSTVEARIWVALRERYGALPWFSAAVRAKRFLPTGARA